MMEKKWNIAVVGAESAIGRQVIEHLEDKDFPVGEITYLGASGKTGAILEFKGKAVAVKKPARDSFQGIDIAFFAGDGQLSMEFCPIAREAGAVCIDLTGAWSMDPDVPVVVPEVNPRAMTGYGGKGIIAVPAGSVIQLAKALKPLHDFAGVTRVVVSTYQSVSGSGSRAIEELRNQVVELLNARIPDSKVYPHRIAFNCLPQVDSFREDGLTREEARLVNETRGIMAADMGISATCVRVPVFYGDSATVNIATERAIDVEKARELIDSASGCEVVDEPAGQLYPMASDAVGQDLVQVGRIRKDDSIANGLNLWLAADGMRQVASCAVQIAGLLTQEYLN